MTKEVSVTMEGMVKGQEEAPVVTTALGSYYLRGNKHYIQFEELTEDGAEIKNLIRITADQVEMTKRGVINSEMVFDINQKTELCYQTSYGTLYFEAQTSKITVTEEPYELKVLLEYCLFSKGELISENHTTIKLHSRGL